MKKLVVTIVCLCALMSAFAQQTIEVKLRNGETKTFLVWDVENISFGTDSNPLTATKPESAIDLGLSVNWSPINLGAQTEDEIGFKVGWGDETGKNNLEILDYFPSKNPPKYITATKHDIAHTIWGDDWRLPTDEEINELLECNWTREENGWRVTSKTNGNSIFLPDTNDSNTSYWTGVIADNTDCAQALTFDKESKKLDAIKRYIHCAVRPVNGEYKAGVELELSNPNDVTTNSARFVINISGEISKIDELGFAFTTLPINEGTLDNEQIQTHIIPNFTPTEGIQTLSIDYNVNGFDFYSNYYCFIYAIIEGQNFFSNVKFLQTKSNYPVPADSEAIDLGLGVKWAPYNVGASTIGNYGGLYGWADPTGTLTSTNPNDYTVEQGIYNISNTKYDIAHVQWKSQWRMPTEAELKELFDNCTKEWVYDYQGTGVRGYMFTGPNGNKIFFPYAGYREGNSINWKETTACMWSADVSDHGLPTAVYYRGTDYLKDIASYKYRGLSIRPVFGQYNSDWDGGQTGGNTGGSTDNPGTGGNDPGNDPTPDNPQNPDTNTEPNAIDLGLDILWADRNVGASTIQSTGDYFCWGETQPHSSTYFRYDYQYYITGTTNGFQYLGSNISGNAQYDAATANLGGKWRMPTEKEVNELVQKCTVEFEYNGGMPGYTVTGPNGKKIFFPAGGYKYENTGVSTLDAVGSYWSSTSYDLVVANHSKDHDWAYELAFDKSSGAYVDPTYRFFGRLIRPVKSK